MNNGKYPNIEIQYNHLLGEILALANELNIHNSLELSIYFSYLLWNGYLSKSKKHLYQFSNRKNIDGLMFADIIDGRGVCYNQADFLTRFLNFCGYDSTLLFNLNDQNTKLDYKLNIKKRRKVENNDDKIFLGDLMIKIFGNHVFTLIEDKDKIYIFDVTRLCLLRIKNSFTAEIINGNGLYKLKPYLSYLLNNNHKLLSKLLKNDCYDIPYSNDEFRLIGERIINLLENNLLLIEDFYLEIKPDLLNISQATDQIMELKRKK